MNSSKLTTAEMLDLIPFRGRVIDCNYYVFCKCCEKRQRLWYGSAREEMRERMEKGLDGKFDCPSCLLKKQVTGSVIVMGRIPVENTIKDLYMMSQSTGIDYAKAERDISCQNKMDSELESNQEKSEWLLKQHNK